MALTRINIGPVHPSTHGVLRLVVDLNGDTIEHIEPHIGFLHRGVEKLVETRTYMQNIPYMEKLDYIAPMSFGDLYMSTVEGALGVEVSETAQYARMILLELQRVASHLLWLGTMCNDLGQMFTGFMWAFRDRDKVLRLIEQATGQRMFYVNMRPGGLVSELPANFRENAFRVTGEVEKSLKTYTAMLEKNPLFMERMKGVGVLSREDAKNLGVTGPVLRASGITHDVRKDNPYYMYKKLNFVAKSQTAGDNFARYKVRMLEIMESTHLVRDSLRRIPASGAQGMQVRLILPSAKNRISQSSRELPRGEGMMYMVADSQKPYRLSIRSPNFINLAALSHITKGYRLADLFAILGSLDIVMGDVDK